MKEHMAKVERRNRRTSEGSLTTLDVDSHFLRGSKIALFQPLVNDGRLAASTRTNNEEC